MADCDCCNETTKRGAVRKPNYQKLVDIGNLPKYSTILGDRLDQDGSGKLQNPCQPKKKRAIDACKAAVTTRGGVPMTQTMPCEKFMPKDSWEDPCKKKPKANLCVMTRAEFKNASCGDCDKNKRTCGSSDYDAMERMRRMTAMPKSLHQKKNCGGCDDEKAQRKAGTEYMIVIPKCPSRDKCGNGAGRELRRKPSHQPRMQKLIVCMPDNADAWTSEDQRGGEGRRGMGLQPRTKDYYYRCESRELLGSKMLRYCECVKRNGLQDRCPRTPCRGRPACLVKPWPECWPSGGCHGQDYDRVKGVARVNPWLEYRRDNPRCPPEADQQDAFDPCESNQQMRIVFDPCS